MLYCLESAPGRSLGFNDSAKRAKWMSKGMNMTEAEEQVAIATFLSGTDNEIAVLGDNMANTRQIKDGMLQELLREGSD